MKERKNGKVKKMERELKFRGNDKAKWNRKNESGTKEKRYTYINLPKIWRILK